MHPSLCPERDRVRAVSRLCFLALLVSWPVHAQVEWFVGNSGPGTADGQFATLNEAVQHLKVYEKAEAGATLPAAGVRIHVQAGVHRLTAPIVIAAHARPVSLLGPTNKGAIISGGRTLENPQKVRDPLA